MSNQHERCVEGHRHRQITDRLDAIVDLLQTITALLQAQTADRYALKIITCTSCRHKSAIPQNATSLTCHHCHAKILLSK